MARPPPAPSRVDGSVTLLLEEQREHADGQGHRGDERAAPGEVLYHRLGSCWPIPVWRFLLMRPARCSFMRTST